MEMYEVDLRSRITGDSVECIYSGDDHTEAYNVAENWNKKNLADYDANIGFNDYHDCKTEGLFACVYHIEDIADLHGVGKF